MGIELIVYCSNGHKESLGDINFAFGHCWQCPTCKEVNVKVYPQGGGREWVIIPEQTARFHRLVKEYQEKDEDEK